MDIQDIIELLETRYPQKVSEFELTPFQQGKRAGIQAIIYEIKAEVENDNARPIIKNGI